MSLPSAETQAKVASDSAQNFVDHFYDALNRRHQLAPFYASASNKLTAAGVKPDISVNGHVCATVADLEALLEKQGGPVTYDVQSFDAQPVNAHYIIGATDTRPSKDGDKISFAVQVAGTVKYGKGEDAETRAFNEAFVLVPHWEAMGRNAARNLRRYLIVSQNFRAL